jgi:hypothetical protein
VLEILPDVDVLKMISKNYIIDFDDSSLYDKSYYFQGTNPRLLKRFMDYLISIESEIDSVFLCMYLYNNHILNDFLMGLSSRGIDVKVFSIPLEGYDTRNPMTLVDFDNPLGIMNKKYTKYSAAKEVYDRIMTSNLPNFELYICPHMYIRSANVRPFSRGDMPYSLHAKTFLIKLKNGEGSIGLTSSNFAVRDAVKDELLLIIENENIMLESAQDFFGHLILNSIQINRFKDDTNWLNYNVKTSKTNSRFQNNFYVGPFYLDSQKIVNEKIKSIISFAKERVYVCAQHISAYQYQYSDYDDGDLKTVHENGFLYNVIEQGRKGVSINCLSQTFVDPSGDSRGCRRPENIGAFQNFIEEYGKVNSANYYVNKSVHCKFIVADDIAIISTCNFTPTQFIYISNVNISKFKNIPDTKYQGTHSEVGQFIFINDKGICNNLVNLFNSICQKKDTFNYKINKNTKSLVCPKCGGTLRKRNGKFGDFLGCSNYPDCKYSRNIF